jgi:hypothetical protein
MLNAGTYTYFCIPHCPSMAATLIITNAANAAPSVTITNPANNATFAANSTIQIGATATDADGTVTNVAFLIGSTLLTNDTVAPYSAATNLPGGTYTLSAVASDNSGAKATNSITITVNAAPVVSLSPGAPYVVGENSTLNITVSGTDTDALTFTATNLPPGATFTGTGSSRTFSWKPDYGRSYASPYAVSFGVSDGVNSTVTTNASISVTQVLTPVTITNFVRNSSQVQFQVNGLRVTRTNFIQASTNLPAWTSLLTNVSTNTSLTFTDTNSAVQKYYRVQEVR